MVIWFNNEKARIWLEANGLVYTFRTSRKQFGRTMAVYNDPLYGVVSIGYVIVSLADESRLSDDNHNHRNYLHKYVENSGFEDIDDWLEGIKSFTKKGEIPEFGMILKVIIDD